MSDIVERMLAIQAEHERSEREDDLHWAHVARSVAALADDEELMWRMGVREWDIVGGISPGLRAEVIRQAREHVANLADALTDSAYCECSPAEVERGVCVLCGRPFPTGGSV